MAPFVPVATAPRRSVRPRPSRRALMVGLGMVGFSLAVLAPLSAPNLRRALTAFASPPAATVAVAMSGRTITPAEIHVPRDAAIKIEVTNLDGPRDGHRFKTSGQVYDLDLAAWGGQVKSDVMLTAREPGRYAFICSIRGHATEGMVGVLVVE